MFVLTPLIACVLVCTLGVRKCILTTWFSVFLSQTPWLVQSNSKQNKSAVKVILCEPSSRQQPWILRPNVFKQLCCFHDAYAIPSTFACLHPLYSWKTMSWFSEHDISNIRQKISTHFSRIFPTNWRSIQWANFCEEKFATRHKLANGKKRSEGKKGNKHYSRKYGIAFRPRN